MLLAFVKQSSPYLKGPWESQGGAPVNGVNGLLLNVAFKPRENCFVGAACIPRLSSRTSLTRAASTSRTTLLLMINDLSSAVLIGYVLRNYVLITLVLLVHLPTVEIKSSVREHDLSKTQGSTRLALGNGVTTHAGRSSVGASWNSEDSA